MPRVKKRRRHHFHWRSCPVGTGAGRRVSRVVVAAQPGHSSQMIALPGSAVATVAGPSREAGAKTDARAIRNRTRCSAGDTGRRGQERAMPSLRPQRVTRRDAWCSPYGGCTEPRKNLNAPWDNTMQQKQKQEKKRNKEKTRPTTESQRRSGRPLMRAADTEAA